VRVNVSVVSIKPFRFLSTDQAVIEGLSEWYQPPTAKVQQGSGWGLLCHRWENTAAQEEQVRIIVGTLFGIYYGGPHLQARTR